MEYKEFHTRNGQLWGFGGDAYIGAESFSGKKFTHIVVGSSGATFTALTIRGVDVVTAKNISGISLPSGYILSAGGDDYFDSGTISAGSAQGLILSENPIVTLESVAVDNGVAATGMTPVLTFGNTGGAGSLEVEYSIQDSEGTVVEQGVARLGTAKRVYFLSGDSQEAIIQGLTYPSTADTGYVFKANLAGSSKEIEDSFDVTE